MSGGAYDYIYSRVDDMADSLRRTGTDPRRASFQKLLKIVSKAMHDIEWVDSCDYGIGDDHAAIDACFAFMGADPVVIAKAHAFDELRDTMQKYFDFNQTQKAE